MAVTPFPREKSRKRAAVSTWRNALLQQAMALKGQARDLIVE